MIEEVVGSLVTPGARRHPVSVDRSRPLVRDAQGSLLTATLVGPDGDDASPVSGGIWDAMGGAHAPRTLAQLSNLVPPTPQLYERLWRVRSLSLLSGRSFPIAEELTELDRALPEVDDAVCVDIGCSEGLYARHLAARGARVIAIDHSRPFLKRARARADRAGTRIAPVRATAQRLPIRDDAVDAAVIGGSLNEIGDRRAAVGELARVVRPGGIVFVMSLVTATTSRGRVLQRVLGPSGIEFPSLADTTEEFEAAGFDVAAQALDRVVARTTLVRRPD